MIRQPGIPDRGRLRSTAARLAADSGLRLVVLFGSHARGEPIVNDLDIGVLGDGPTDTLALTNRLIRELGFDAVDVTDLRRADPLLLALAARDGIPLYEREGEFARFASLAMRQYWDTAKFREMEHREIRDFLARRSRS